jgi:hypothetical protein
MFLASTSIFSYWGLSRVPAGVAVTSGETYHYLFWIVIFVFLLIYLVVSTALVVSVQVLFCYPTSPKRISLSLVRARIH